MTFMQGRTYFDAESGSIMDLPPEMWTKRGEEVRLKAKAAVWQSKNTPRWADAPASVESAPAAQEARELQPGETSIVVETMTGERRELIFPAPTKHRVAPPVESTLEDEHAPHRYGETWNRPGEYAAYRERVEAQFSAPVPQDGDTQRAVSIVISGFPASGKSTIGRIVARALMQSGIRVRTQGLRATLGVADVNRDTAELDRIRLSPATEPMEVELWEIDRASPNNH